MSLRPRAALGGLTAVVDLHVSEMDNGLAFFFEMGSQTTEVQQVEEEAPIPKIPAERRRLEEAALKRIAGEKVHV